jgi:hypothetical protein
MDVRGLVECRRKRPRTPAAIATTGDASTAQTLAARTKLRPDIRNRSTESAMENGWGIFHQCCIFRVDS